MRYYKTFTINPKEIGALFRVQMQAIYRSKGTIILLVGLMILPSFYAWFNIYSVWDPYSKTGELKVAVVNDDRGYTFHEDNPKAPRALTLQAGDMLAVELNKRPNFNWQFVSRDKALRGVKDGRYYAAIVINKDFSRDLTGFIQARPKQAKIDFYVNEKINAISPKITETGMNTLQAEIDKAFTESLSKVVLNSLADLDDRYLEIKPTLIRIIDNMDLVTEQLNNFNYRLSDYEKALAELDRFTQEARQKLPENINRLRDVQTLTLQAQDTLLAGKNNLSLVTRLLDEEIASFPAEIQGLNNDLRALSRLSDGQSQLAEKYLNRLSDRAETIAKRADSARRDLTRLQNILSLTRDPFGPFISRLDALSQRAEDLAQDSRDLSRKLKAGTATLADALDQLTALTNDLGESGNRLSESYLADIRPQLLDGTDHMMTALNQTYKNLGSLSDFMIKSGDVLSTSLILNADGQATLKELDPILKATVSGLSEAQEKAESLKNDPQFVRASEIIKEDISQRAKFIANPIVVKKIGLYPLDNYGSAMAPFYTVLALWVGGMLTMSIVSPVNKKGLAAYPTAQFADMYVSRLLLFVLIGICQGLVVSVGNLLLLGITVVHPWLYLLANLVIAGIFACFIFSLVFTFSNIGKALAIVLLVFQISAGGGTFPVEMTPRFFRMIHPVLPFTYAISLIRELSAGIYLPTARIDILALALLPIFSFLLVLIFGPALRHLIHRFEKAIKNGGLE